MTVIGDVRPFFEKNKQKIIFWFGAVIWKAVLAVAVDMRTITLRFNRTYPANGTWSFTTNQLQPA